MKTIDNYRGMVFGDLKVLDIDPAFIGRTYNSNHWLFECACGNIISEVPSKILNGHKKSCGCRKTNKLTRHGCYKDPFYHTWWGMMQRCYNSNHHNYKSYGGRGIRVCNEWQRVEDFTAWAHQTYNPESCRKTLDRIDNDGHYEPANCRWSSAKEQANNRRITKLCTLDGVTKPLSEWCEEYDMPISVVGSRLRVMGWDIRKALTTPVARFSERGELVEINGVQKTIKEWSEHYDISRSTIYGRVRRGMDLISAITTPLRK